MSCGVQTVWNYVSYIFTRSASHWLSEFCQPITGRSEANPKQRRIVLDTQLSENRFNAYVSNELIPRQTNNSTFDGDVCSPSMSRMTSIPENEMKIRMSGVWMEYIRFLLKSFRKGRKKWKKNQYIWETMAIFETLNA